MPTQPIDRKSVSIELIREIARAPVENLREERIQAAAVLWFLSGIRIGAFTTMPIGAVDIGGLTLKQWPSLGVKTKYGKHATTYMLSVPELLKVVAKWDDFVRTRLPASSMWFAPLSPVSGDLAVPSAAVGRYRDSGARKDLVRWLDKVGLRYLSPHKFRHGFAEHAFYLAKGLGEYKAISQNLMHSDLSTTDRIYGILSDDKVKDQITSLGASNPNINSISEEQMQLIQQAMPALNQYLGIITE